MKRTLSMIALAVLSVGLLGSCAKINERLDNLEKKIGGIENEQIASINTQIANINSSIADLGQIRSDISNLKQSAENHGQDIFDLQEADEALGNRILNLEDYLDVTLPTFAEKDWVIATFSTLEQYEATCDTIAKIEAKLGTTSEKLSKDIKACADSLTKWVNKTFEGYYTAAQMDAKLTQMKAAIDSAKASGGITGTKADSISAELTATKTAVDTAKAAIRAEYRAAIDTAIKTSEGKLTQALQDAVATVNGKIESLTTRVGNLETSVNDLLGRVKALEGMIQSVTIVPAYSDGSLEDVEAGILTIDCIISPASAAQTLKKGDFKVLVNTVKTKAVTLDTAEVSDIKVQENGIVSIYAQAPIKPANDSANTAAVRIKDGEASDYTTAFYKFGYSDKNVKVVDLKENATEYNKVYMSAKEAGKPKDVEGKIPVKYEGDKKTFDPSKPTVIEVRGIGTVTFDKKAVESISTNAADADSVFFTVKDVTIPAQKQSNEIVYQVTMTKVDDQGEEVFSESKAAGEVTMEIPLDDNVADVTSVTLLDGDGDPIEGGVVYGSIVYDWEKNIVTFKVNHFSKYAVGYVLKDGYKEVTGVSLDRTLELEKGASKNLTATITPSDASNKNVIWSSSDTTKVKVDKDGKVTAVALGTATVTVTTMSRNKTATCEVTVVPVKPYVEIAAKYNGSTTTTLRWYRNNLAITDSGNKAWKGGSGSAVKVPGTDENVVVGDYFPWGAFSGFYGSGAGSDKGLLPYTAFSNTGCGDSESKFTFKESKQFNQANAPYWSGSAYTKYNATDKKMTLDASDDVASIILGDTWRMPTADEFKAMKAVTYWEWDETDKGYYVFTPNTASDAGKVNDGTGYDKSEALLFFPTAGNGYETTFYDAKDIADYWASSLNSTSEEKACHLFFNSSGSVNADSKDSERYRGFSVRPVQDPAAKYVAVTEVKFDVTAKEIKEDDNVQLNVTVTPSNATRPGVYWTSSDPTKATVDATGKVTAKAVGTATITVTTVDGKKTATCEVVVRSKGKGTKEEPYLIYDAKDLQNMDKVTADVDVSSADAYAAAVPTYFKMVEDVDMTGEVWTPLNAVSPYAKKVDFNGNGKTISNLTYEGAEYGGMFGVLNGEVYNLNLIDAMISTTKDKSGLLCGYMGTGSIISGIVHHCKVTGTLTVNNNTIGGIAGLMCGGEIYACEVDATINQLGENRYYAGGIIGCGVNKPGYIHDCITKGEVVSAGNLANKTYNRNVAGIAGALGSKGYKIENCISLSSVHCNAVAAGIVGHMNNDSWGAKGSDVDNYVIGCIAWNESITMDNSRTVSQKLSKDDYAMGGGCIMGWGCPENTLQNCWRKPNINFLVTCPDDPESAAHFKPFNQEDAGPGNPLQGIDCNYRDLWSSMYHGKAATAGETASQVAKRLGWDETIWDLSGDIPSLKRVYAE